MVEQESVVGDFPWLKLVLLKGHSGAD